MTGTKKVHSVIQGLAMSIQKRHLIKIFSGGILFKLKKNYVYKTDFRYIFNLGNSSTTSDYVQVVKVETCLAEGEECNIVTYQHRTVCRQRFVYHRLVVREKRLEILS